jgi:tRNA A37 methylthiotransferase MiaB
MYGTPLAGLLRELNTLSDGVEWLRLMYAYPSDFTDEMIDAIAECERVVNYIDIPLQHQPPAVGWRSSRRQFLAEQFDARATWTKTVRPLRRADRRAVGRGRS